MSNTTLSLTYQSLLTSTLMKVLDSGAFHDNVFEADVMLSWLRSGNRIKTIDGGERIRLGLLYGKNSTAGSYEDYDQLDVTAQEGATAAFFNWKQYSVSVSINGREIRANKGPSRLTNLQQEKITQASLSLVDELATGIYSDGTGNGSKDITGLAAMIETTPGTASYASVPVANTAWRNQVQASVGAAATNLLPKMRTLYNDCKQGKGGAASSPDYGVTTQAVHEALEALLFPQVRYQPNPSGGADAGLSKLTFKGATIDWDDYCTSGTFFWLNSRHILMFVHQDANFKMNEGGFQKPINQDALVAQIFVQGNLATNNRRKLGKLQGIT
uniref:Putative capsid protein n=1 Tax=viral metagenome TaxID=1070528 RepID=A0A6M3L3I2_9ZZZZ